jgi:hypothetical protein
MENFHDLRVGPGNLHYAGFDALWIAEGSPTAAAHPAQAAVHETHPRHDHGALSGVLDSFREDVTFTEPLIIEVSQELFCGPSEP